MSKHDENPSNSAQEAGPAGVLALFDDVDGLMNASRRMRDAGFTKWEAHAPFPVHGLDEAAGIKPSILPWICLVCGLLGTATAVLMQWWMNAYDYPFLISGKPYFSLTANIPVAFEMTILFAAFAAFFGMLGLNGFPRWSNPLFRVPEFARITADRFAIVVDSADPNFNPNGAFLKEIGASQVITVPADDSPKNFPIWIHIVGGLATCAALIPIALIIRARYITTDSPPIHLVPDMDFQWKNKAQTSSAFFEDGQSMRKPVEGTVSVGTIIDPNLLSWTEGETTTQVGELTFRTDFPLPLTDELLDMGQELYAIHCAPCHGAGGFGDGPINKRAMELGGGWIPASNLHDKTELSTGQLYDAITNGVRGNMMPYATALDAEERWAVVAYIRALQRSQNANTGDLPQGTQPKDPK